MRNLKRALSLVLAAAMLIGMMVVGASAASEKFTDVGDTKYAEAVDVMAGIGVLKGYTDGTVKPLNNISRAEVAAMIYRIYTGDVSNTYAGTHAGYGRFNDVAANYWAAGYIGYCANALFIKGDGQGNFMPDANVTGYQALAMILRAMGYDQNGEFEGSGWEIKVAQTAQQLGILVNITTGQLSNAASRELVAEILFQAIQKPTTIYTPALGYLIATGTPLGEKNFDLNSDSTTDAWGRPATVWYAETSTPANTTYQVGEKVYATVAATPVLTYTTAVTGCDLLKALGYAETNNTIVTFNTYTNGKGVGHTATVQSCHNSITACAAKSHIYGAQGQLMEVYATATPNVYTVVYVDTYLALIGDTTKAVTGHDAYDTVALTVYEANSIGASKTYSYLTGTKAYTKNAYALVTMADGVVKTATQIAPAATATSAYWLNTAAGQTTIVGGVTYNDANKFFVGQNTWDAVKTWNVYTDTYGNIIGLVEYVAPNTYAYGVISAMKWVDTNDLLSSGYVLSNIVKMDATTMANTILAANALFDSDSSLAGIQPTAFSSNGKDLGDYNDSKVSETTQYNGEYADTLFEYTLNPNGTYNITNKAYVVSGTANIKAGVANLWADKDDSTKVMATNDNTVYLVKTGNAVTGYIYNTYVGYKNVPSMNGVKVQFLKAALANGVYSDYVFVDAVNATYDGQAGYVWFTKNLETTDAIGVNATGDKAYLGYIDGVLTPVYVDAASEAAVMTSINGWDLYQVTRNADGDITSATRWTNTAIADVTGITGTVITNGTTAGTLNVTGAEVYAYAADGSSVTPVALENWSSVVVNTTTPKTAYVKDLDADGIIDIIYVVAD